MKGETGASAGRRSPGGGTGGGGATSDSGAGVSVTGATGAAPGPAGGRRGRLAALVRAVEVEAEVEVGVRVVGRRLDRRGRTGYRLRGGCAAEEIEERRIDVHRVDLRAAVGARPDRLRCLEHRYRAVPRAGHLFKILIWRVVVWSHTVTLSARNVGVRAGMPGRWGSGHERAPFGHAA
nr:hypothetical protein GCM10020092_006200 [Actinoplanes digitatis]